jgi:transposase
MNPDEGVMDEIERITLAEGMVDFCRDLRDSMTFYDRDVLLATYTGILESMMITALCQAGRHGPADLARTADRLEALLNDLPQRLSPPPGPLDIESFLQRFLEGSGQGLLETFPVYRTALWLYFTEPPVVLAEPDRALYEAHRDLRAQRPGALERLGRVGAAFLRGASLSAGWLRLDGNGAEAAQSLWTLRDTVVSVPGLEAMDPAGRVVVDLGAERAVRRSDASVPPAESREDRFWDALARQSPPGPEEFAFARQHPECAYPLRALVVDEAVLDAAEDGDPMVTHVARVLADVAPVMASEGLVEALAQLDADAPAVADLTDLLESLGPDGTRAVAGYIEVSADVPGAVRLAPLLARRRGRPPRDRRVFDLLADLLARATWGDGKERVAAALADYGDARAVPLLERELKTVEPRTYYQEQVVRRALHRLRSGRRPPA